MGPFKTVTNIHMTSTNTTNVFWDHDWDSFDDFGSKFWHQGCWNNYIYQGSATIEIVKPVCLLAYCIITNTKLDLYLPRNNNFLQSVINNNCALKSFLLI